MDAHQTTIGTISTISDQSGTIVTWPGVTQAGNNDTKCQVCQDITSVSQEMLVIQLIFPTFTLAANSVTTVAIYRARRLASTLRMSLLNLSFTDILASLLYIYHIAFSWTSFEITLECIIRYYLYVTSISLTLLTIKFMSVDRFLSIFFPFVYEKLKGRYYISVAIALTWIITLGYTTIGFSLIRPDAEGCFYPLMMRPEIHLMFALASLLSLTVTVVSNIFLCVHARKQINKIAAILVGDQRQQQIARLELKSTITTVSLVVPYVLMNCPMYILMMYFYCDYEFTKTIEALWTINALSSLGLVNSLINPSIYIWRSSQIRDELRKMGRVFASFCQWANNDCLGTEGKRKNQDCQRPDRTSGDTISTVVGRERQEVVDMNQQL